MRARRCRRRRVALPQPRASRSAVIPACTRALAVHRACVTRGSDVSARAWIKRPGVVVGACRRVGAPRERLGPRARAVSTWPTHDEEQYRSARLPTGGNGSLRGRQSVLQHAGAPRRPQRRTVWPSIHRAGRRRWIWRGRGSRRMLLLDPAVHGAKRGCRPGHRERGIQRHGLLALRPIRARRGPQRLLPTRDRRCLSPLASIHEPEALVCSS